MIYSVLLIGQSNMSGRGDPAEVEPISDKRIKTLRNGRWHKMFVPVHWERRTCGICLAESFAQRFIEEHPEDDIGLIPCADGGSSIAMWEKGQPLYDHAVMQTKLALRSSHLAAILWHQGESDCSTSFTEDYEEKLLRLIENLRKDLDAPAAPFVIGGLGDFLPLFGNNEFLRYRDMNVLLSRAAEAAHNAAFVSAEGLTDKGDNLHFDAKSLREFGLRYYDAFRTLHFTATAEEKKDTDIHTEFEVL